MQMAVAAFLLPKRKAAQTRKGKERYSKGEFFTTECKLSGCETIDEIAAGECFKCVATGDTERSEGCSSGGEIDKKGSSKNCGPYAIAEEQQSGKRDTSARPDGGGAGVHESELEGEFSSDEIHDDQPYKEGRTFRSEFARHGRSPADQGKV